MFRVEIDKGDYIPPKDVSIPYIAVTQTGRVVLVHKESERIDCVVGMVLRAASDTDSVGTDMLLDESSITPLAEGKQLVLTNTWEIANG